MNRLREQHFPIRLNNIQSVPVKEGLPIFRTAEYKQLEAFLEITSAEITTAKLTMEISPNEELWIENDISDDLSSAELTDLPKGYYYSTEQLGSWGRFIVEILTHTPPPPTELVGILHIVLKS